jgi:hypothetical protein
VTKRPSRQTTAAKQPQRVAAVAEEAKAPPPATLHECLAPLAAVAVQCSMQAYRWGVHNRQLMRASMVMALAEDIVNQCARLLDHEDSAQGVARDVARQMDAVHRKSEVVA